VAAAASVLITAVFALAGEFHMKPSATNSASPPAAASQQPDPATTQQPAGGADAALPVKVKRSSGASTMTEPTQQAAATRSESLALAAAPQPGTASAPVPGLPGAPKLAPSSSSASSSGASSATGNLVVTPGQLDLGHGTTGQITLTAKGGPVRLVGGHLVVAGGPE
jgi:cytoskeletal protein RodZ